MYNTLIMDATIRRKQTAFRLNEKLLDVLKRRAAKCNRSLNNYVESLLVQAVYDTPNNETIEAINETRSGRYAGTLDMTDFESFMKSVE